MKLKLTRRPSFLSIFTKTFNGQLSFVCIRMYLFKEYARTAGRLKPTINEIFMRMFVFKFFVQVITSNCSQLCATCAGTWAIIIIRFTALNISHVVVNIDSEGL